MSIGSVSQQRHTLCGLSRSRTGIADLARGACSLRVVLCSRWRSCARKITRIFANDSRGCHSITGVSTSDVSVSVRRSTSERGCRGGGVDGAMGDVSHLLGESCGVPRLVCPVWCARSRWVLDHRDRDERLQRQRLRVRMRVRVPVRPMPKWPARRQLRRFPTRRDLRLRPLLRRRAQQQQQQPQQPRNLRLKPLPPQLPQHRTRRHIPQPVLRLCLRL
jgi:hypothetical protein